MGLKVGVAPATVRAVPISDSVNCSVVLFNRVATLLAFYASVVYLKTQRHTHLRTGRTTLCRTPRAPMALAALNEDEQRIIFVQLCNTLHGAAPRRLL